MSTQMCIHIHAHTHTHTHTFTHTHIHTHTHTQIQSSKLHFQAWYVRFEMSLKYLRMAAVKQMYDGQVEGELYQQQQ